MAYDDVSKRFVDTTPQPDDTTDYRDGTHIPDNNDIAKEIANGNQTSTAIKVATWIRQKRYGVDVREALALWVELIDTKFNTLLDKFQKLTDRQKKVEERQTQVENDFRTAVAGVTSDSEVVLARNNSALNYNAETLDDLLEYMGGMIAKYVPSGFVLELSHTLGRNVQVTARLYQNAFDTEEDGFGSVSGAFGGSLPASIPIDYQNKTTSLVNVSLPKSYATSNKPVKSVYHDNIFYLIDGKQVIELTLS